MAWSWREKVALLFAISVSVALNCPLSLSRSLIVNRKTLVRPQHDCLTVSETAYLLMCSAHGTQIQLLN